MWWPLSPGRRFNLRSSPPQMEGTEGHRLPGPGSRVLGGPRPPGRDPQEGVGGEGGFSGRVLPRVCESRSSSINSSPWMTLWTPWLWLTGLVISCSFSLCIWAYTVLPGRFLWGRGGARGAAQAIRPRKPPAPRTTPACGADSAPGSRPLPHVCSKPPPPGSPPSCEVCRPGFPSAPGHGCSRSVSPGT